MRKPLEGIKVLDLTTFVAAPVTARLLGDMGADVIKVERPDGDGWREYGIAYNTRFSHDANPVFDIYNSGKKMIALNLKNPDAKEIFWKLLKEADVFVTNTRPDALARLGFGYEEVKKVCPRLIYAIVLGYGEEGPEATSPAFDSSAFWTRSGFLRDMAFDSDNYYPVNAPAGVGDTATGYNLVAQICAALYNRDRTGEGDYVSSGLYNVGLFTMGTMEIISQPACGAHYPKTREEQAGPGSCYKCADGDWIFMSPGDQKVSVPKMFRMMGRPDLAELECWQSVEGRRANKEMLYRELVNGYLQRPASEWVVLAKEFDLPLVRMNHFADTAADPQAWANGYLENMTCPSGYEVVMPNPPIRMQSVGEITTVPAGKIGADTQLVLEDLGYTKEEIDAMESMGAIARLK